MSKPPANSFSAPEWLDYLNRMLPAYEFQSFVAQGGMGAVFKARQRSLDRDVAVKILSLDVGGDETFRQLFETEARAMARLNHPNLIGVYASGEVDGMPYIVMEYVPGKSLYHSAYGKRVDPAEAVRIIRSICLGLAHAHENGVIHRDIKPANILLTAKAEPKIGDFGLALPHGYKADGPAMGTAGYVAPEVIEHPESADRRADLYAVGAILYELVSGKRPDGKQTAPEDLKDCPASLQPICRRALHPNVQLRYPDAHAMAAALEEWQRKQSAAAPVARPQGATAGVAAIPVAAVPPATGGYPAAAGSPAKRPERSLAPVPPPTATTRTGLHDNWYLLIRILLFAAILGSMPFTYKAIIRYRDRHEEEKARQEEAAAHKEKHPPSIPRNFPPPSPQPSPTRTEPKWEPPLEALARLRNHLKSGKRDEFPAGTVQHGDCHYLLVSKPMTWLQATGFAENHGGHLAIPSNSDDLRWLAEQTADAEWIWLGLGKNSADDWLFSDGKPWNLGTPPLGKDSFATINHFGVLKTADTSQRLPFLIQWHDDGKNPAGFTNVCKDLHSGAQPAWPPGTVAHKQRHYYLALRPMRWEDARTAAQKAGGKLVVVSDAEEAFWLKSLVVKNACEDALWTGGRYANNQWTWATKEEWNPTGWFVNTDTHNSREVLLLDPIHGWMAKAPDNTPRGFVIEWSDDPVDHITAPPIAQELPSPPPLHEETPPPSGASSMPSITPSAPMPQEVLALEPRAKQLIAAAVKERDDQLVANAKQFGWDIDVWVRTLSRADQSVWLPEATALKQLVRGKYVPEGLPEDAGIRLSPQMGKVATFCADKQKAIEAGFLAKARKIQEAYLAKLNTLAGNESSLGHEDNAQRLQDMESSATNLESWVQALGYRLGHDRKSQRP